MSCTDGCIWKGHPESSTMSLYSNVTIKSRVKVYSSHTLPVDKIGSGTFQTNCRTLRSNKVYWIHKTQNAFMLKKKNRVEKLFLELKC